MTRSSPQSRALTPADTNHWRALQRLPTTGCYAENACFFHSPHVPSKSRSYVAESSPNEPNHMKSRPMWLTSLCFWNEEETAASLSYLPAFCSHPSQNMGMVAVMEGTPTPVITNIKHLTVCPTKTGIASQLCSVDIVGHTSRGPEHLSSSVIMPCPYLSDCYYASQHIKWLFKVKRILCPNWVWHTVGILQQGLGCTEELPQQVLGLLIGECPGFPPCFLQLLLKAALTVWVPLHSPSPCLAHMQQPAREPPVWSLITCQ